MQKKRLKILSLIFLMVAFTLTMGACGLIRPREPAPEYKVEVEIEGIAEDDKTGLTLHINGETVAGENFERENSILTTSITYSQEVTLEPVHDYYDFVPSEKIVDGNDDGETVKFEATKVEEPSDDADLSELEVDPGDLQPAFNADVTDYTVAVDHEVDSIDVTATLSDENADLVIDGDEDAESGEAYSVNLGEAGTDTEISIGVTAEDGVAEKEYSITVRRAEEAVIESIEVKEQPVLNYTAGEELDLSDMEITETYTDGSEETVEFGDAVWEANYRAEPSHGTELTVADDGETVTVTHTVSSKTADTNELTLESAKTDVAGNVELEDADIVLDAGSPLAVEVEADGHEETSATIYIDDSGEFSYTLENLSVGETYTISAVVNKEETSDSIYDRIGSFTEPSKTVTVEDEGDAPDFTVTANDLLMQGENEFVMYKTFMPDGRIEEGELKILNSKDAKAIDIEEGFDASDVDVSGGDWVAGIPGL